MNLQKLNISAYFLTLLIFAGPALAASPVTHSSNGTVTHNSLKPDSAPRSPFRHVPDEILVRFRDSSSTLSRALIHSKAGTSVAKKFKAVKHLQLVKLPRGMTVHQALKTFSKLPEVLYAEPNYIVNAFLTPNDTRFSELWGLHNIGQTGGVVDADIDAPEAWDLTTGNANAVVAVIDTGVDYTHPDLAANMFRNSTDCNNDGIDDDGNGYVDDCYGIDTVNNDSDPMDDSGHGTHVAGTIGAVGNNASGVVGVNWTTSILACKFLDSEGFGNIAGAIGCLDYVVTMKDRGVNIVATNNSWGGGAYSSALRDAINAQRQRGILFVAAAGNDYSDNETILTYPCSFYLPNVLCVASTDAGDGLWPFSNYGNHIVHLGAPGENILSTVPSSVDSSGYALFSGTSMATPHVTGVVCLIKALYPGSDWRAVKNRILAGGDVKGALAQTVTNRRLNAYGALTCANSTVLSRLRPLGTTLTFGPGTPIELAMLHINCADANGNVAVTMSPTGETITLLDNGVGNDQVAGDGIYTGTWITPAGGTYTLSFPGGDNVTVDVDPDLQAGFPVKAWYDSGSYQSTSIHALIANVNGDNGLQILATSTAAGPLNAWNNAGIPLSGWPIYTPGTAYPAAGRLSTGSPGADIFITTFEQPSLSAFNGSGASLPGWPRDSVNYSAFPATLADVDGDGLDEIFVEEEDFQLHAYKADGSILPGWPVQWIGGQRRHTPAIADLDGDGNLEIITTDEISTLLAYRHTGALMNGFPVSVHLSANSFPVIGDVDGDGQLEIVVVGYSGGPVLFLYGANGVLKRSIPLTGGGTVPALADLDGDGVPEIIIQTDNALNVVRGDGTKYPGFPVVWRDYGYWLGNSAPVVGDVDGDGIPDIVVTSRNPVSEYGYVRVYGRNGASHPRFPKTLPIGFGAVSAIADIDGDGRNEIIITGDYWDGRAGYFDKVWVYDLGGPAHGPVLWSQFMGNAKHTGVYTAPSTSIPQPTYHTLSVTATGNGSVLSNPGEVSCGSNCSGTFESGTPIILTATAARNYRFNGWGDACAGQQGNTCMIVLDTDKKASAEFVPLLYTLTVSRIGSGAGSVTSSPAGVDCGATCTATYNAGASVTLTSAAVSGHLFNGWGGACAGQKGATCAVAMDNDKSVSAEFVPIRYTLTVSRIGSGSGSVTSSPAGVDCGTTCTATYNAGTSVTLTAAAADGTTFSGWSEGCAGQGNSCSVTMSSDVKVTATFQQSSSGDGGKKRGCFIATAAYGNPLANEVKILREFRDKYLLTNRMGKAFVALYYEYSPTVADYIRQRETLRAAVRAGLWPLVYSIKYPFLALNIIWICGYFGYLVRTVRRTAGQRN